jgi:lysophospholipase L1-like esterase
MKTGLIGVSMALCVGIGMLQDSPSKAGGVTNGSPMAAELKPVGAANLAGFADKVRRHAPVTVGYLGGSITVGAGASAYGNNYYCKFLTAIEQAIAGHGGGKCAAHNAGIGGTGSGYGAFRVGAQLLSHRPDLTIVEFAVNDGGTDVQEAADGMEGIVRQALRQNPAMALVFFYTTTARYEQDYYAKGLVPPAVAAHHRVAEHYGILEVHSGPAVHQGIQNGVFTVETFFRDGVHPADIGHAFYGKVLADAIIPMLDLPPPVSKPVLPACLGSGKYEYARLDPIVPTGSSEGWTPNDKQWNWSGVRIWTCDAADKPIGFIAKGKSIQLVYMGKIKVKWTVAGKERSQDLTGHANGMPMPSSWSFPADLNPDGKPVSVAVVPAANDKPHGEIWGLFSLQLPIF